MKTFGLGVIGLVFSLTSSVCLAGERKLNIASTEYPPYYSENLPNGGFLTEIVVEAFKRVGYEVEIKFLPFPRAVQETKEGKYDGLYSFWYRKEREEWFVYSDELPPPTERGFYKQKDKDISFRTFEDLRPYVIGVYRGAAMPPGFDEASLKISEATDDEQNLRKLHKGRIDLALTENLVAKYVIRSQIPNAVPDLEWLPPALHVENQFLVLSKKTESYATILADFNRGLREIEADGTYEAIIAKHGY